MIYQVRLLKGIFEPQRSRYQLQNAEAVTMIVRKLVLLYILSFLIFAVEGYFGIGSESFSKNITKMDASEFEFGRLLVLIGDMIAGIVYPSFYVLLSALFFWVVADIPYIKGVIVQMIVFSLHMLEKVLVIPLFVLLDIGHDANPFSLGVISQYFIRSDYFIHFFSEITLFQVIIITLQYYYLKLYTERSKIFIFLMIVLFTIAVWLVKAFLAYLQVGVFI